MYKLIRISNVFYVLPSEYVIPADEVLYTGTQEECRNHIDWLTMIER